MDGSQFSQIVSTFPSRVIVTSRLSPSHRGHMERHAVTTREEMKWWNMFSEKSTFLHLKPSASDDGGSSSVASAVSGLEQLWRFVMHIHASTVLILTTPAHEQKAAFCIYCVPCPAQRNHFYWQKCLYIFYSWFESVFIDILIGN